MKFKFIYILLIVLISSCGPRVSTTKMGSKNLNQYESFAYLPNSNFEDLENFDSDQDVGMAVIQNVNRNMKSKGYELDRNNPDLLVLLETNTDMEKTVSNEPVYARYPNYYGRTYGVSPYYQNSYYYNYGTIGGIVGYDRDVNRYKEGSLILTLVDSDTKNIVWEGVASDEIYREKDSRAIAQFVDDMFGEFPVNQ